MVVRASGLKPTGDWLLVGSGDVPHDELGPPFELEEHDGDDSVVAAALFCESVLARAAEATLLLVSGGLKIPENLARSFLVCASRPLVGLEPVEPCLVALSKGLICEPGLRCECGDADGRPFEAPLVLGDGVGPGS